MSTVSDQVTPLVSVVVAAFNAERSIAQTIESILNQTYANFELNIIDDGSSDKTAEICRRYLDDVRLNYVRQSNRGQANAKNAGMHMANGSLIAFCDADDYWEPNKLSLQIPLFAGRPNIGVVYGLSRRVNASDQFVVSPKRTCHRGKVTKHLFRKNFVSFGTAIVRKRCIEELGGFDERYRMGIDWDLWLRISTQYDFDFVPEYVYVYRVWEGQMSRDWRGRYEYAFEIMENFVRENKDELDLFTIRIAYAHTWATLAEYRIVHRTELCEASRNLINSIGNNPFSARAWVLLCKACLFGAARMFRRA